MVGRFSCSSVSTSSSLTFRPSSFPRRQVERAADLFSPFVVFFSFRSLRHPRSSRRSSHHSHGDGSCSSTSCDGLGHQLELGGESPRGPTSACDRGSEMLQPRSVSPLRFLPLLIQPETNLSHISPSSDSSWSSSRGTLERDSSDTTCRWFEVSSIYPSSPSSLLSVTLTYIRLSDGVYYAASILAVDGGSSSDM